jgi:hypothetical protein
MKKNYTSQKALLALLLTLGLFFGRQLNAQVVLYSESFETDGEGSRYTSNTYSFCPDPDYFLRTNMNPIIPAGCAAGFGTAITNVQGSFYWAGEDIMSNQALYPGAHAPGFITSSLINISSYASLNVSFFVACSNNATRWETQDSVNVHASINGGAFRTVGRIMGNAVANGNLIIDANLNGAYDAGSEATPLLDVSNMTMYTFNIPGTGSNLRVRLDFDQFGGTEPIAVDLIQVRGTVIVPVKWASFSGQQLDESVKLAWTTTEEVNVREFIVERLAGDGMYTPIGTVDAHGTASSYDFVDPNPVSGINQYRIQQVDADNAFSFSEVIEVQFNPAYRTALYPNPMNDGCRLVIEGEPVSGTLRIIDNVGRICRSVAVENTSEIEILRENLEAGSYFIRLDLSNGRALTKKLMVHD